MQLEEIRGFASPQEYKRFLFFLESNLKMKLLTQIDIPKQHDIYNGEKWYVDANNIRWRLIPPDYPFKGVFEKI